jgi:hypothetical protein
VNADTTRADKLSLETRMYTYTRTSTATRLLDCAVRNVYMFGGRDKDD